ncbi:MAG TPA: iron-sulfur cluster assembly scaffold protein [Coxiellaceae bacterium]|nr:iron-sulfur cluster assembly scaffold protein [Coxiellaceae bacterium]
MKYSEQTLYYFHHTLHAGQFNSSEGNIISVQAQSKTSSDQIYFYLKIVNNSIQKINYQASGSVALIACAEYLSTQLEQQSISALKELNEKKIMQALLLNERYKPTVLLVLQALNNISQLPSRDD